MINNLKEIVIKSTLFDPCSTAKKVQTEQRGGKKWYKVFIRLDGINVLLVSRTIYFLHSSFEKKWGIVIRKPDNHYCFFSFWTTGMFTVKIQVEDHEGCVYNFTHRLNFDDELKESRCTRFKIIPNETLAFS